MNKLRALKNSNKGFTLVEVIVVLVILAILAAISIPSLVGYIDNAKQKQILTEARAVYVAAQAYATEQYAAGTADTAIVSAIETGTVINTLVGETLGGTISGVAVSNAKVTAISYTKSGVTATYNGTTFVIS